MSDSIDQEVEAIKAVLTALAPLSEKARASVLDYVAKRLDLPRTQKMPAPRDTPVGVDAAEAGRDTASGAAVHIKQFKEQKRPRSANEMAAVIAYYLANLAPPEKKKDTVNQKDIETYFKIGVFPLPQQVRVTLPNAKNAGYFDLVGDGEYKLNAVGHNLVAHTLPRGTGTDGARRAKRTRRPAERAQGQRSRRPNQ